MYKLTRNKVGETSNYKLQDASDWGVFCTIFRMVAEDKMEVLEGDRPTIGWQIRLDNPHTYIQTSPVVEIILDEPNKIVFRTKSGSKYTWEITGGHKVIEYPDFEKNKKEKEDAEDRIRKVVREAQQAAYS